MAKEVPLKGHFTVSFLITFKVIICKAFRKPYSHLPPKFIWKLLPWSLLLFWRIEPEINRDATWKITMNPSIQVFFFKSMTSIGILWWGSCITKGSSFLFFEQWCKIFFLLFYFTDIITDYNHSIFLYIALT